MNNDNGTKGFPAYAGLIGVRELAALLAVTERSIFRWIALGKLPRPIRLGGSRLRWRRETIERFLAELETAK